MDEEAQWDELKQSARRSERALYVKLSSLSKAAFQLASCQSSGTRGRRSAGSTSRGAGGGGGADASSEKSEAAIRVIEQSEADIEGILEELGQCVADLRELLDAFAHNESHVATLKRFEAILSDSKREFVRTQHKINQQRTRLDLFGDAAERELQGSGRRSRGQAGSSNGHSSRTEMLLREQGSITSSIAIAEHSVSTAVETRAAMRRQKDIFDSIGDKMMQATERFPTVNRLIKNISAHKQRDNIVLAAVIASCMFFTFFYMINK